MGPTLMTDTQRPVFEIGYMVLAPAQELPLVNRQNSLEWIFYSQEKERWENAERP